MYDQTGLLVAYLFSCPPCLHYEIGVRLVNLFYPKVYVYLLARTEIHTQTTIHISITCYKTRNTPRAQTSAATSLTNMKQSI